MVFALLYITYSANSTANYYYPYISELSNHTMMILRHGDASSEVHVNMSQQAIDAGPKDVDHSW